MRFRPCIDIHNGKVKQIVGGTLEAAGAVENYVSSKDADYYAGLYRKYNLSGGHIILLNKAGSDEYEATKVQALKGLSAYPRGMHVGGGINADNAEEFLVAGASHVIVTSYVFKDGKVDETNLKKLVAAVGKENLVLDLSCKRVDGNYVIATDRWQKLTEVSVTYDTLDYFADYCDEFLIHAVDVEGKQQGIEEELVAYLAGWKGIPVTYAGGVKSMYDLELIDRIGEGRIDVTVGSALDLFGGTLDFKKIADMYGGV